MSKKWDNAELLKLGDMYRDGMTSKQIGEKLGRTARGVEHAIARYRDVINVEYRKKGAGPKPVKYTPIEKNVVKTERSAWWKFW